MDWIICRFCRRNFPAKDYKSHVKVAHKNGQPATLSSTEKTADTGKTSATSDKTYNLSVSSQKRYRTDVSKPSSASSVRSRSSNNSFTGSIDEESDDEDSVIAIPTKVSKKIPEPAVARGRAQEIVNRNSISAVSASGTSSIGFSSDHERPNNSEASSLNRDHGRRLNVAHVAPTKNLQREEYQRMQNSLETSSTCSSEASTVVINTSPPAAVSQTDPPKVPSGSSSNNADDFLPSSTTHDENDTEEASEGSGSGVGPRAGRSPSISSMSSQSTIRIEQSEYCPSYSSDASANSAKSGRRSQLPPPPVITEARRIDIVPSRNTRYMCHICGSDALFLTGAGLAAHMKSHDVIIRYTYACSVCRQQFSTKVARDEHLAIHREDHSDEIEIIEEIPKECSTLRDNSFGGGSSQPTSTNRRNNPPVIDIDNESSDTSFPCYLCRDSFSDVTSLNQHIFSKHNLAREKT